MTEWTFQNIDYSKAKAGDTISDDREITYITDVHVRPKPNAVDVVSPEIRVTFRRYSHDFHYKDEPGAGVGLPCDKDGNILERLAWRYAECKADDTLVDDGVMFWDSSFTEPAVIHCVTCGDEVALNMIMTNTCRKCGSDYNISGDRLAPRSQWGWDTGESLDEILSADWSINDPTPGREE